MNQAVDTVTFRQPTASMLDEPLFKAGDIVELYRDDKRWFLGRAASPGTSADARDGVFEYTLLGPWWYLETMGFRQKWNFRKSTTDETLEEKFNSYVILGTKPDGSSQSIADQIKEAVNYAIEQGAPIQLEPDPAGADPYLPSLIPPSRPAWNVMVAEAIRIMCRNVPDIVSFWDYSTEPHPTLCFRRRARLTPISLPARNKKLISSLRLQPREDLVIPGVVIYYLSATTANGVSFSAISEDIYPPGTTGREPKAIVAAINLQPTSITFSEAQIACEKIEPESEEWWRKRMPNLAQENIKELKIASDPKPERNSLLPNQIFGQWAPWMGGHVEVDTVKAFASYTEESTPGLPSKKYINKPILFTLLATDLEETTYRSTSGQAGELAPTGVARAIYEAASVLHFDGQFKMVEQECSGVVGLGNAINFTEGRPEWKGMNAQVYSIAEDIDQGTTTVYIGPSKNLGPDDYMELLRSTWERIVIVPPSSRATGQSAFSGAAVLGKEIQREVPTQNQGGVTLQAFQDPRPVGTDGRIPGKATIDISALEGKQVSFIKQRVCVDDGRGSLTEKWMLIWGSEPFD